MIENVEGLYMIKQEAIECLQTLPDTVDWEDIQYALYEIQKIKKGMETPLSECIPLAEVWDNV